MANTKIPVELSSTPGIVDNSDATAITIDSGERVGIGTTSPSSSTKLEINGDGELLRLDGSGGTARSMRFRGLSTSALAMITIDGSFKLHCEDSGTHMEFHTADTERMRITSSGDVGIGTQNPLTKLHLDTGTSGVPRIRFSHANTGNDSFEIGSGLDGITNAGWQIKDVDAVVNRFMIDTNGNIGMGNANVTPTVSASAYTGACLHIAQSTTSSAGAQIRLTTAAGGHTGSDGSFMSHYSDLNTYYYNADGGNHLFYVGGNLKFKVTSSGGESVSDEKYKENIKDISYGLDIVKSLQPREFTWKDTKEEGIGFIAQEVKPLINEVVSEPLENGPHESSYTLNYDALTAVLTKAIQEQQTIIEDLKSRIETLEG
tara:strand:- start:1324 stop:2445 length:1122 start_codon:yes stop_codon:yes gene_type:complete